MDPEIVEMVWFLDPEIVEKVDKSYILGIEDEWFGQWYLFQTKLEISFPTLTKLFKL